MKQKMIVLLTAVIAVTAAAQNHIELPLNEGWLFSRDNASRCYAGLSYHSFNRDPSDGFDLHRQR